MTIEEQLLAATAAISGITAERDDLRATVEKLTVGAASELEALKVEAAAKDAKLTELTAALEAAVKDSESLKALVAEHEASKVSASKEAAKIVASVGVAPVEISPADYTEKSVEQIREEYSAMKPSAERVAFLKKHQMAILYGRTK